MNVLRRAGKWFKDFCKYMAEPDPIEKAKAQVIYQEMLYRQEMRKKLKEHCPYCPLLKKY